MLLLLSWSNKNSHVSCCPCHNLIRNSELIVNCGTPPTFCTKQTGYSILLVIHSPSSDEVWSQQGVKWSEQQTWLWSPLGRKKVSKSLVRCKAGIKTSRIQLPSLQEWDVRVPCWNEEKLAAGVRQIQKLLGMQQWSEVVNTAVAHADGLKRILSGCFSFSKPTLA